MLAPRSPDTAFSTDVAILCVAFFGCLSPEQQVAWNALEASRTSIQQRLAKYDAEIEKVRGWIEAGKIDGKEGQDVINAVLKERTEWVDEGKKVANGFQLLKEAESPWWLYALSPSAKIIAVLAGGGCDARPMVAGIEQRPTEPGVIVHSSKTLKIFAERRSPVA